MKTLGKITLGKQGCWLAMVLGALAMLTYSVDAAPSRGGGGGGARGGGGGARPSMGNVGGGGGRPAGGGGSRPAAARPSTPRPNTPRPSGNRPSMGNASRPSQPANRPATRPAGGFNPSGGGRPNVSRPATKPGGPTAGDRPAVRPPANLQPATRPSLPGGGGAVAPRPGGGNRPDIGTRPGGDRPSFGNATRPTPLPGIADRPGGRPGGITPPKPGGPGSKLGPGGRPGGKDRPDGKLGPGDKTRPSRPGQGGSGEPWRPGGDRPIIGGGGDHRPNRPNRPGIDNGFINNGNINIGNDVNFIGNRPGWYRPSWNNPSWGWGGGWSGYWHDHCIDHHHHWYNGCWTGYWGSDWYAPLAWSAVGWGIGSVTSGWGYGAAYYNPYYVAPAVTNVLPYDYSQPIIINNYVDANAAGGEAQAARSPESEQALKRFDDGLAQFKSGNYRPALGNFDAALKTLPNDPVVHEARALALFALGEYQAAAVALNSILSSAPGMDWTSMISLYGNADDYTAQLRKLEEYCRANKNDAAAYFVLAYHYLVTGAKDAAVTALKVVTQNQPKDATAKRMLDALSPAKPATPPTPKTSPEAPLAADAPGTDLVGTWRAKSGSTTIELAITEDSQFTWKATQSGKPAVELKGELISTSDAISLESKEQGAMAGTVKSLGPDKWRFSLNGAPASDPGLSFERVSK